MTPPVLVGCDLGTTMDTVLAGGLALADALETQAVLVHIGEPGHLPSEAFDAVAPERLATLRRSYRDAVALDLAKAVTRHRSGAHLEMVIVEGRPYEDSVSEQILEEAMARGAELIVLGSLGKRGIERMVVGHTALRVERASETPVFVVDSRHPWRGISQVLFAADLQREAQRAAWWATRIAGAFGASLSLVHVSETEADLRVPHVIPREAPEPQWARLWQRLEALRRSVEETAAALARGPASIGDLLLVASDPASAIVRVAEERSADVIVLGTHARRGLAKALLGSVAERVLRQARAAVLTVHEALRTP
jgi:nucleotide-binding universal stress UspA family protein